MYKITTIASDGTQNVQTQGEKPELSQLQKLVGGLIENVPHWNSYEKRRAQVWCNEEGLLDGLPFNQKATELWRVVLGKGPFSYEPRLFGDVIIVQKGE